MRLSGHARNLLLVAAVLATGCLVGGGVVNAATPASSTGALKPAGGVANSQAEVAGTSTYSTACHNTLLPDADPDHLVYTVAATALSPVAPGQDLTIMNQHWDITMPAPMADLLRGLGVTGTLATSSTVTVAGAHVSPGSSTSAPIASSIDFSGGMGTDATGSFDVPDMVFVPTGGTATFTLSVGSGIATTFDLPLDPPTALTMTCLPTSGSLFLSVDVVGLPGAPTGVAGTRGDASATVTWVAPPESGLPIDSYNVAASPGGHTCTWTAGPLTCTVTGLLNGTPYTFTVTAHNTLGNGSPSAASAPVTPGVPGSFFYPLSPARIIDSRPSPNRVGSLGPWGGGVTQNVTVIGGLSGVPSTATAVVLNITVTGGTVNGDYLSIWPAGATQPTVSSLNFNAGQTIANSVTVKLGVGGPNAGRISVFNAGGTVNVIVDVNGYYGP